MHRLGLTASHRRRHIQASATRPSLGMARTQAWFLTVGYQGAWPDLQWEVLLLASD